MNNAIFTFITCLGLTLFSAASYAKQASSADDAGKQTDAHSNLSGLAGSGAAPIDMAGPLARPILVEQGVPAQVLVNYGAVAALLLLFLLVRLIRMRREIAVRKAAEQREHLRSETMELLADGAPLSAVLAAIVRALENEDPEMQCCILLIDETGKRLGHTVAPSLPDFYTLAMEGLEIGSGVGSSGTAAYTGERVIAEDIATHPYWVQYRELAARAGLRACWAQPIRSSSGQVLGTVAIYHRKPHRPSSVEIYWVEHYVRLASIAIEKNAAAEKLRVSEALYRLLAEDVSDVIWRADENLHITYINPMDEQLRGFKAEEVIGHHVFEMFTDEGIATVKEVMRKRAIADLKGPSDHVSRFEVQHRCKDGRLLWAEVMSKPERDAQGKIVGYHGITRETTERKRLQDEVRQLAYYDPLTRLPNRRLLQDRLNQSIAAYKRSGGRGAVLFLDLDNFKTLNDTHGHDFGDLLLIHVAERLKSCVRAMDTVSRFGGDEFVVLITELDGDAEVARHEALIVAEKIRVRLAETYRLTIQYEGQAEKTVEHDCTASIGVVEFSGASAVSADILKDADAAMYEAKYAGRNRVRFAVGVA